MKGNYTIDKGGNIRDKKGTDVAQISIKNKFRSYTESYIRKINALATAKMLKCLRIVEEANMTWQISRMRME